MIKINDLEIHIIPALSDNYVFVIKTKKEEIICIDPSDFSAVDQYLIKHNIKKIDYILNTHHHFDHIGGNKELKKKYSCKIVACKNDNHRIADIDIEVEDNDKINLAGLDFQIFLIVGHTLGHIAYYNQENDIVFVGDTLFSSGCGRIFEGTAEQMFNSLEIIKKLPSNTKIFVAHEYTLKNIEFALSLEPSNQDLKDKQKISLELRKNNLPTVPTTLENELKTNPFLRVLNPELRKNIGTNNDHYQVEVFAKIRKLKDFF